MEETSSTGSSGNQGMSQSSLAVLSHIRLLFVVRIQLQFSAWRFFWDEDCTGDLFPFHPGLPSTFFLDTMTKLTLKVGWVSLLQWPVVIVVIGYSGKASEGRCGGIHHPCIFQVLDVAPHFYSSSREAILFLIQYFLQERQP